MLKRVTINGAEFKIQEMSITDEPVWSKDTGRTSDGKMTGTVIAWKLKLELKFPPLSDAQAKALGTAVHKSFFDVRFHNPRTNADETHTMYAGTPTYPVYNYDSRFNAIRYVGVAVNLIER